MAERLTGEWTLEDWARSEREKEQLEVSEEYLAEKKVQYDQAARILNLAGRSGLPWDIIEANPDAVERAVEKSDFNPDTWMKESPEFRKFAAENPYNLAVLMQDAENLSAFEREWKRPLQLANQASWAQVELTDIWNRRAQGREYWQDSDDERIKQLEGMMQEHHYGADNWFSKFLVNQVRHYAPTAEIIWAGKEEAMLGGMAGAVVGGKVGAAGGTMLAGPAGTGAGLGIGATTGFVTGAKAGWGVGSGQRSFEMMRGEQYGRFIQAGFSHEDAARVSRISGAISTLPELGGAGKFLKHIPGIGKVAKWGEDQIAAKIMGDVLTDRTVANATKKLAFRFGETYSTEIGTELLQDTIATVGQNYLAYTTQNPDAHVGYDEYIASMQQTFVQTAKGIILMSAAGPTMSYFGDMRRARRAQQNQQTFQAIADAVNKSETRTKAPATYRKFVERVTEKEGAGVYINANRMDELFQEANLDPDEQAERLGIDKDKLRLARENDLNVEIPAVAFAEQLAPTEMFDSIKAHLTFDEDGMSAHEAALFDANKPEIIQDIEASIEKLKEAESRVDAEKIVADVTGQLIAADLDEYAAGTLAQLFRGFGVLGERLKTDPEVLFNQFFGGVRRVTPEALQRTDVKDPAIDPLINRLRRGDYPTQREMYGMGILEFLKGKGGLQDQGGELSGRDLGKIAVALINNKGMTLDEAAELAAEAGFIAPDYSPNKLLDAIDRELAGDIVRGRRDTGDETLRDLSRDLDELDELIRELDLNLAEMSNEEVRNALLEADMLNQELSGDALREVFAALVDADEQAGKRMPNEIDGILAKASALMPLIYSKQDFGDITITDRVYLEDTGEAVEITEEAQTKFDEAKKRQNALKRLLDCVSG